MKKSNISLEPVHHNLSIGFDKDAVVLRHTQAPGIFGYGKRGQQFTVLGKNLDTSISRVTNEYVADVVHCDAAWIRQLSVGSKLTHKSAINIVDANLIGIVCHDQFAFGLRKAARVIDTSILCVFLTMSKGANKIAIS